MVWLARAGMEEDKPSRGVTFQKPRSMSSGGRIAYAEALQYAVATLGAGLNDAW